MRNILALRRKNISRTRFALCIGESACCRGGTGHKTELGKLSIQELITEDEDSVSEETVDNTDQTPPAATAEVNMMTEADAEEFDQLDKSYFLGL